jgi:hypothetical protein
VRLAALSPPAASQAGSCASLPLPHMLRKHAPASPYRELPRGRGQACAPACAQSMRSLLLNGEPPRPCAAAHTTAATAGAVASALAAAAAVAVVARLLLRRRRVQHAVAQLAGQQERKALLGGQTEEWRAPSGRPARRGARVSALLRRHLAAADPSHGPSVELLPLARLQDPAGDPSPAQHKLGGGGRRQQLHRELLGGAAGGGASPAPGWGDVSLSLQLPAGDLEVGFVLAEGAVQPGTRSLLVWLPIEIRELRCIQRTTGAAVQAAAQPRRAARGRIQASWLCGLLCRLMRLVLFPCTRSLPPPRAGSWWNSGRGPTLWSTWRALGGVTSL